MIQCLADREAAVGLGHEPGPDADDTLDFQDFGLALASALRELVRQARETRLALSSESEFRRPNARKMLMHSPSAAPRTQKRQSRSEVV